MVNKSALPLLRILFVFLSVFCLGACGIKLESTIRSALVVAPEIAYGSASYSFDVNVAAPTTTPSISSGTITACAVTPALPSGLSLDPTTCSVSGTPTVNSVSTSYTITPSNSAGAGTAQVIGIAVVNPIALTVASISHATGSSGFTLTITGTGFAGGVTAKVEGVDCTSTTYLSPTQVMCVVPNDPTFDTVDVSVVRTTDTATLTNAFLRLGAASAWYDAGTLATSLANGAEVSSWPNSISGGLTLTQSTPALRPDFLLSGQAGLPSVSFLFNLLCTSSDIAAKTIFLVNRYSIGIAQYPTIYGSRSNVAGFYSQFFDSKDDATVTLALGDGVGANFTYGGASPNAGLVNTVAITGTEVKLRLDSVEYSDAENAARNFYFGCLGGSAGAASSFDGEISEIIVYNAILSPAQILEVEGYLNTKY